MLKVGLTGGIGSGKSVISKVFEILGIPVYNSDNVAKYLINNLPIIKEKLIYEFGNEVFDQNGNLNQQFLAQLVFNSPGKLNILNSIIHPEVREDFVKWLNSKNEFPYIIKEAAIIVESETYKELDYLIVVTALEKEKIKRVMERDNCSENEVKQRMKNQLPDAEKIKVADFIINNNENEMILKQIISIHNQIIKLSKE